MVALKRHLLGGIVTYRPYRFDQRRVGVRVDLQAGTGDLIGSGVIDHINGVSGAEGTMQSDVILGDAAPND